MNAVLYLDSSSLRLQDGVAATLQLTRITGGVAPGSAPLFVPGLDEWDGLSLHYTVPWPLHLLLTPQVSEYDCVGNGNRRSGGRL